MTWQEDHRKRVAQFPETIRRAHTHATEHREEIEASDLCGCFYCLSTFDPTEIKAWTDTDDAGVGQCALCPRCGIDSIIGSESGFPITQRFLQQMKGHWFGESGTQTES